MKKTLTALLIALLLVNPNVGFSFGGAWDSGGNSGSSGGGFVSPATEDLDMDGFDILGAGIIEADQIVVGGANEKIAGTTYGEYIDFLAAGDDFIRLGGTGGTSDSTLDIDLDGTVTLIPSSNNLQVKASYVSGTGMNVKGNIAAGDTSVSATAQANIFNSGLNSASSEIGLNGGVTQAGSGNITGVLFAATTSGAGTALGGSFQAVRSGAGSSASHVGVTGIASFSGTSGTQTTVSGVVGRVSQTGSGGTITTAAGVISNTASTTSTNGTITTYYGGLFTAGTVSGGGAITNNFAGGFSGNVRSLGTSPTLSSCGTTPSISGGSFGGKITVGSGTVTSCTATFATAFPSAPSVTVTGDNTAVTYVATSSTTAITITSSADMAGDVISYQVIGV